MRAYAVLCAAQHARQRTQPVAVLCVRTAFPEQVVSQRECKNQMLDFMRAQCGASHAMLEWTERAFDNAGIATKHMAFAPSEIYARGVNYTQVQDDALKRGMALSRALTARTLRDADMTLRDVSAAIVGTELSNGVPQGVESFVRDARDDNPHLKTYSLSGQGCAGAALNLSHAVDYLQGHPTEAVLVLNVDLYSRLWRGSYGHVVRESMARAAECREQLVRLRRAIVPAVLMGDAASCMIVLGAQHPRFRVATEVESALTVCASAQVNAPQSDHLVEASVRPYGVVAMLHEDLPRDGARHVQEAIAHLKRRAHVPERLSFHVVHPGSAKVLRGFEAFVPREHLQPAYDALARHGNCASPTAALVLKAVGDKPMTRAGTETGLLLANGPGMKALALLLQRQSPRVW